MNSDTAESQQAPVPAGRPVLDAPDRAPLRARIRAGIERRRPWPVAVRTLELLAEAGVEPTEGEPGYRIVDRHGAPRLREGAGEGAGKGDAKGGVRGAGDAAGPLTLDDLLDDLQARHPALFRPPEPQPEPEADREAARESAFAAGASEVRAATARFVESQSGRVRSLAERSTSEGRALAQSAAGRFAGLRARFQAARPAPVAATGAPAFVPSREPDAADRWNARVGRGVETLRDRLVGLRARLPGGDGFGEGLGGGDAQYRRWLAAGAAAVLAMVGAAALVVATRPSVDERGARADLAAQPSAPAQPPASLRPAAPAQPAAPPPASARNEAAEPAPDAPPEDEGRTAQMPEPPEPVPPNATTGPAQVIDTATLRVGGKLVHLFGVEWVRGGQADELAKYIAGRSVACQPVPGSEGQLCRINGRDLSEVVLFNGGGRASPEATPELVAAEDHARTERLGVWKR